MTIPPSRSPIFEVKSTGSELAFIRVLRLRTSSDVSGRLRTSSGIFGNDRVVFKNPSTPRIKISRLYLRKSWQVYYTIFALEDIYLTNNNNHTNKQTKEKRKRNKKEEDRRKKERLLSRIRTRHLVKN